MTGGQLLLEVHAREKWILPGAGSIRYVISHRDKHHCVCFDIQSLSKREASIQPCKVL